MNFYLSLTLRQHYNDCRQSVHWRCIKLESQISNQIQIYTVSDDSQKEWARFLAISQGKIIFVGSEEDGQKFVNEQTQVIKIPTNGMLMPGFQGFLFFSPMAIHNQMLMFIHAQQESCTFNATFTKHPF